jgi:DNA (cytosine-5)-methyltransferase 1
MAGSRESAWGKEKVFREGQAKQTLDDLVFVYIETINKLKPKVAILENVKGMIAGNAKAYVKEANRRLNDYGYNVQIFLLNAASMGVPQRRERVFFVCSKKELNYPKLKLEFNEKAIAFGELTNGDVGKKITGEMLKYWELCPEGSALSKVHPKGNYFGSIKLSNNIICNTIIASNSSPLLHNKKPNYISDKDLASIGSYPQDYNFKTIDPKYLIGMSVPPVMIAQIANQILIQWFKR